MTPGFLNSKPSGGVSASIDSKNQFDADSKNRRRLQRRAAAIFSWLLDVIQHISSLP
jgi:hypothetical protein